MKNLIDTVYEDFIKQTVVPAINMISEEFISKYKKKIKQDLPSEKYPNGCIVSVSVYPQLENRPDSMFTYFMYIKIINNFVKLETRYTYDSMKRGHLQSPGQFEGEIIDVNNIKIDEIVSDIRRGWSVSQRDY